MERNDTLLYLDGVTVTVDDVRATPVVDDQGRLRRLDAALGSVSYTFEFDTAGSPVHYFGRLTDFVPTLLIVGVFLWFVMQMQNGGKAASFGRSRARRQKAAPDVTFADVAGEMAGGTDTVQASPL
mgnify:CR=1 FL=1